MKKFLIFLIEKYQNRKFTIFNMFNVKCKYYPTCSEYTKQAIIKYGVLKGCLLGFYRILRCNPFSKGGYDPLK